ncbi:hypothetical protein [Lewinella cohaerens]|uniref:hypothetical protein n=1 Tax=Lewinella cohaerens TaxID=70995 RepID=UPI00036B8B51|nr:hypothetical protein [Lewinella cohaerens]
MTTNEFLLLGILATGVILINWNTIKRDLSPPKSTVPKKASPPKALSSVEKE